MQESLNTILVIEDDTVTRNLYLKGLKIEGFNVIGAENGVVGVQKAQEHLPDIIICDIMMPQMDGYSVLTILRQDSLTAGIPFIFLTASDMRGDLRKGMELGADDYITKPSTLDELLKAIATRLRKQASVKNWCNNLLQKTAKPASTASAVQKTPPDSQSIFPAVPQLKEVFDFIEAYFHQGITLCDVAAAVGYSPAYLTNRVAKQTGDTINNWIVKRRMAEARRLLQNSDETVEQISRLLGYQHVCHFSRQFRQHHGLPPHAWRLCSKNKEELVKV
ncbi:response regulator [Anabaena sp. FACHB-709]|uniref:Two-component response regulator n=2 Tax=Nostocaceae TaxID=1162 RepID=A0A1Z4KR00_ANAVA|nr:MULTISPECIES: response regulator [Nostocaceae]BAY71394.1 two-component response regulator [Trichormus variabilis NIES-23]HBW30131.1 DNA-binding response regulator [Nostoc sp. UBA8866]MBD2172079.1 response regulator [Anabaena cylindrica FACHB-318]MBD2263730.1 response regulator [Anabaena sp. FACHB-709]MBD2274930.1 response regulator [Nostoc sp. PCC 7120 = FACHB-418]